MMMTKDVMTSQSRCALQFFDFTTLSWVRTVFGCRMCQMFGKIFADAVEETMDDKLSQVMTLTTEVVANHVLAAHVA